MTEQQLKEAMLGEWVSIAPDVRPSAIKSPDGNIKPFYLTRAFTYRSDDGFELIVQNLADPYGKVPLAELFIKGRMVWPRRSSNRPRHSKGEFHRGCRIRRNALVAGLRRRFEPGRKQRVRKMGGSPHAEHFQKSLLTVWLVARTSVRRVRPGLFAGQPLVLGSPAYRRSRFR